MARQDNLETTGDQLTVTMPATLLAQIDAHVGGGFVDRQEFIRGAVRHYVEYLQAVSSNTQGNIVG